MTTGTPCPRKATLVVPEMDISQSPPADIDAAKNHGGVVAHTPERHHGCAEVHIVDAKRCIARGTHDMRELPPFGLDWTRRPSHDTSAPHVWMYSDTMASAKPSWMKLRTSSAVLKRNRSSSPASR